MVTPSIRTIATEACGRIGPRDLVIVILGAEGENAVVDEAAEGEVDFTLHDMLHGAPRVRFGTRIAIHSMHVYCQQRFLQSSVGRALGSRRTLAAASHAEPQSHQHDEKTRHFLSSLLPEQLLAINGASNAMRVKAGPGSGKTRVVTAKVASLLSSGNPPESIMVITFTNKAAEELKERLSSLVGPLAFKGLVTGTFHSIAVRILKSYIQELPEAKLSSSFTVLDADDSERIMRKAMESILSLDGFASRGQMDARTSKKLADELFNAYSQLRSKHATLFKANFRKKDSVNLKATPALAKLSSEYSSQLPLIFEEYTRICRQSQGVDFDDLLSLTVALLKFVPRVRNELSTRFRHCLVDEFQDVNAAQYEIVKLLSSRPGNNLFVVGDPDQAIYGWRGADPSNMEMMEEDFPSCATAYLVKNFRSCPDVLSSAEALLSAQGGLPKLHRALDPVKEESGHVEMIRTPTDRDEAKWVANKIRELRNGGCLYSEMAVLYRTNMCSRVLEEALGFSKIPFRVLGEKPFWSRSEIKALTSYMRVLTNPSIDSLALDNILNVPPRGIGQKTEEQLVEVSKSLTGGLAGLLLQGIQETPFLKEHELSPILTAVEQNGTLPDSSLTLLPTIDAKLNDLGVKLTKAASNGLQSLRCSVFIARSLCMSRGACAPGVKFISKVSGYEKYVEEGGMGPNESKKIAMVETLYNISQAPDTWLFHAENIIKTSDLASNAQAKDGISELRDLLSHIALMRELDEKDKAEEAIDRVQLMTLHTSKGLEFSSVFFVGLEEGLSPQLRDDSDVQEEKRLAYVGATRAKDRLYLMTTEQRGFSKFGSPPKVPSRFLDHLISSRAGSKVKRTLVGAMYDDSDESSSSHRFSPPSSSRSISTSAKSRTEEEPKEVPKNKPSKKAVKEPAAAAVVAKVEAKTAASMKSKSQPKKAANGW